MVLSSFLPSEGHLVKVFPGSDLNVPTIIRMRLKPLKYGTHLYAPLGLAPKRLLISFLSPSVRTLFLPFLILNLVRSQRERFAADSFAQELQAWSSNSGLATNCGFKAWLSLF